MKRTCWCSAKFSLELQNIKLFDIYPDFAAQYFHSLITSWPLYSSIYEGGYTWDELKNLNLEQKKLSETHEDYATMRTKEKPGKKHRSEKVSEAFQVYPIL